MSRFQVDSEAVFAATSAAQGTIGRVQAEVAALHAQLTGLQSSWTGQASSAFGALVTDWKATQQRVEENLAQLSRALQHAGQQYQEVEQQNARLFAAR